MTEWNDGMQSQRKNKKTLHQKISSKMKDKLYSSIKNTNLDMMSSIKIAQDNLKKINSIETEAGIEKELYGSSSKPAFLWQDKYVASFYFFITMLGYVDSKITRELQYIDYNSKFISDDSKFSKDYKENIENAKKRIKRFIRGRNEIIEDFNTVIDADNSFNDKIYEIISETLSYRKFGELYSEFEKNSYQLNLPIQFMNAYNLGLSTNDYYNDKLDYEKRMNIFRRLYADLLVFYDTNIAKVDVKVKSKNN